MRTTFIIISIFLMTVLQIYAQDQSQSWDIPSPENKLNVVVSLDREFGQIFYEVFLADSKKPVVEQSSLGLIADGANYYTGMTFQSQSKIVKGKESYTLFSGKQLKVEDFYNECDLFFQNEKNLPLMIRFIVFETGIAFSYNIESHKNSKKIFLFSEETSFNIPEEGRIWAQPYDQVSKWTPAYEAYFENGIPVGTRAPADKNGWAFPMLFKTDQAWILITEAGVYDGNASIHLEPECELGNYKVSLPEEEEAFNVCSSIPEVTLPWSSPWRLITVSPKLSDIFESNLVTSLSRKSELKTIDWIQPGRSSWSWWSASDSPKDYNAMMEFIDLSAELGWEYFLVDANWNHMQNGNLEKLADYAASKNVGLLVWYNSGGPHNVVTEEPRNRLHEPEKRRETFAWLQKIGIKGIKVDFFQSDKNCIMRQYTDILKDAANYELVVNFHGCTIPKGWRRTYPNLLSMESVKGAECYKFDKEFSAAAPRLNTIYPFTRNVIGPMDYTPVTFSHNNLPHYTSSAHELALAVVFESGITHFADAVSAYRAQPDFIRDFLKQVPVRWHESRLLEGYPGKEIVVARRSGDTWYVAGVNGEYEYKTIELRLDFLESGNYQFELIADGDSPDTYRHNTHQVSSSDKIDINVLTYGGFVGVLSPVR